MSKQKLLSTVLLVLGTTADNRLGVRFAANNRQSRRSLRWWPGRTLRRNRPMPARVRRDCPTALFPSAVWDFRSALT